MVDLTDSHLQNILRKFEGRLTPTLDGLSLREKLTFLSLLREARARDAHISPQWKLAFLHLRREEEGLLEQEQVREELRRTRNWCPVCNRWGP